MVTALIVVAAVVVLAVVVLVAPDAAEWLRHSRDWHRGLPEATPDPSADAAMAAVPDGTSRTRHGGPHPVPASTYLAELRRLPAAHRRKEQ